MKAISERRPLIVSDEGSVRGNVNEIDLVKNIKIRDQNIKKFKKDFPQFKNLS